MTATPKKIVHITTVHRPFDVRIFEKQCKCLAADGYQVVLVAVHPRDESIDGVTIKGLPAPHGRLGRMTLTTGRAFLEALRQRADIYQIHDPELLPWGVLLRLVGKRVVYDMHENVPRDILQKTWLAPWLKPAVAWVMRAAERLLLAPLAVVFAETSYVDDYRWVRRSVVVLNLPRLDLLPAPSESRAVPPCVTYIGGVSADRGSRVTLEALRRLKDRGLEVGWQCVGPGWPPNHLDELRRRADELGLAHVRFHGYMPAREGWEIVRHGSIGLAVLDPLPNMSGSYPTKLFEYMALQMPVITSAFPLYQAVVERHRCGLCIDPTSSIDLAAAIERLIRDPKECAAMGRRGREAVLREYNWATEYQKLRTFYEQLAERRRTDSPRPAGEPVTPDEAQRDVSHCEE